MQQKEKRQELLTKIYLDDNIDDDLLITALTSAGYTVISLRAVHMRHARDEEHLILSTKEKAILLTKNYKDFRKIHTTYNLRKREHAGIVIFYQYNNPKKDFTIPKIIRALNNLLKSGNIIERQLHVLNLWNF